MDAGRRADRAVAPARADPGAAGVIGFLGLGSNVGDRRENLQAAVGRAAGPRRAGARVSSVYETEPVGDVLDQPDFLNACLRIDTELGPEALLDACKAVERELGRAAPAASATGRARSTSTCCCWATSATTRTGSRSRTQEVDEPALRARPAAGARARPRGPRRRAAPTRRSPRWARRARSARAGAAARRSLSGSQSAAAARPRRPQPASGPGRRPRAIRRRRARVDQRPDVLERSAAAAGREPIWRSAACDRVRRRACRRRSRRRSGRGGPAARAGRRARRRRSAPLSRAAPAGDERRAEPRDRPREREPRALRVAHQRVRRAAQRGPDHAPDERLQHLVAPFLGALDPRAQLRVGGQQRRLGHARVERAHDRARADAPACRRRSGRAGTVVAAEAQLLRAAGARRGSARPAGRGRP